MIDKNNLLKRIEELKLRHSKIDKDKEMAMDFIYNKAIGMLEETFDDSVQNKDLTKEKLEESMTKLEKMMADCLTDKSPQGQESMTNLSIDYMVISAWFLSYK